MSEKTEKVVMVSDQYKITSMSGTLDEFLKGVREEFEFEVPAEYQSTARIELDTYDEGYYENSKYACLRITWQRPENEKEKATRLERTEYYEKQRRETYEAMKKEFEK